MGTGQDVGGGGQCFAGIRRAQQKQVFGIAAQFQKTGGREGAIFQRLIIRPDPEEGFFSHGLKGKAGGETARTPVAREHFVQSATPEPPTQNGIRRRQPERNCRPVMGQAITRKEMAQICQLFAFVHVMFQIIPSPPGVKCVN